MNVVFAPAAARQLEQLHEAIALRSGFETRADGYVTRIIDYCLGSATFPLRGTARDDLLKGLRIIGFERRVVIAFVVEPSRVTIVGVFYGGQNIDTLFDV
jgi:toxin ParE1/3/4